MPMYLFTNRFYTAVAVVLCVSLSAHAEMFGASDAPVPAPPPVLFGDDNPSLSAVLAIQKQIQILKRLIAREEAVNTMTQSALNIGVLSPYITPPDITLCRQVPANIPCSDAYADMYPGFRPAPEIVTPPSVSAADVADTLKGDGLLPLSLEDAPDNLGADTLYWLSVTCFATDCSAVVTPDPNNVRARYRIRTGDALPDGAVVSGISASGVTLNAGDDTIALKPAPRPKPKEKVETGPFG
jgi:hypothetical protein